MPDFAISQDPQLIEGWRNHVRGCDRMDLGREADVTVILLAFDRMWNMDILSESVLKTSGIAKVVVSNNNPEHRIHDWVKVEDARLQLTDQPVRTGCANRFDIAREDDSDLFLCIDDDVFLTPEQIAALLDELRADLSVPHGVHGSEFYVDLERDRSRSLYYAGQDQAVDVLHNVYAFTKSHVRLYFANRDLATAARLADLDICDDVLLSYSSIERPRIHNLGSYLTDPTWDSESIAVFRDDRYARSRELAMRFFSRRYLDRSLPAQRSAAEPG